MRSRFAGILCASLVLGALAGCGDSPTDGNPSGNADTVRFTQRADTLSPGESAAFAVVAATSAGDSLANKTVAWTSSDPGVATVSAAGVVTALAPGSVTITATVDGKQATTALAVVRTWRAISAGTNGPLDATCGLTFDDRAWCWGLNIAGQFGNGTVEATATYASPTAATGGLTWRELTASYRYQCGITTDGRALCWGQIHKNPLAVPRQPTPMPIEGAPVFASIVPGIGHGCGVTAAGAAWCWGRNDHGELGNGQVDNVPYTNPVLVAGGHTWKTVQPGGGSAQTCGLTTAGAAYCWGYGYLGADDVGTRGGLVMDSMPHRVMGGHVFSAIAPWFNGACALDTDGRAWCWGQNDVGTVGTGTTTNAMVPVPVVGELRFAHLASSLDHVCGLTGAGQAYCWGDNYKGKIDAAAQDCGGSCLAPVPVAGDHRFVALTAGGAMTCGLTAGGAAWCWGAGPLGNGTTEDSAVPVRVGHPAGAPAS